MEQYSPDDPQRDIRASLEIRRFLTKNGVFVDDERMRLMQAYVVQLRDWNNRVNLVSRKDMEHLWYAHILHSLAIVLEVNLPQGATLLDLGTGGGLPGIPMKIVRPDLRITLLDATRKKIDALNAMLSVLDLLNVQTLWGRAEDPECRRMLEGRFDAVVARAVAPLGELVAWSRPAIRAAAIADPRIPHLVALKGGDLGDELGKVRRSGRVRDVTSKDLTFFGAENIPGIQKQIVTVYF